MLNGQVIGIGAAGAKAALAALNAKVITDISDILLINSTDRDIPKDYLDKGGIALQIGVNDVNMSGCGKEPAQAEQYTIKAIMDGSLQSYLQKFIKPTTQKIYIVTSTEGGTGCGATPVVASYINSKIEIDKDGNTMPVHVFAFTGFEEDSRGLKNTVRFFSKLSDTLTIEVIRNKKFLSETNGNFAKAEDLANIEFATRLSITLGNPIVASDQNMDERDLIKTSTYPGYINTEYREITDKIKNQAQFDEILQSMIDDSKCMDVNDPAQKILAVIINMPEKDRGVIDNYFKPIREAFGEPFEVFRHIQSNPNLSSFIAFISAGMNLPIDEVKAIQDKYNDRSNALKSRSKDSFFDQFGDLEDDDDDFTYNAKKSKKNDDFLSKFGVDTKKTTKGNLDNY